MNLREAAQQALDVMEDTRWAVADQAPNEDVAAHDKAMNALRAALAEDVSETNFGNIVQVVDSTEADDIPDATKMIEPVAYSYTDAKGRTVLVSTHTAPYEDAKPLYTAPPKREPLTDEEISKIFIYCGRDKETFARAIERAHGIGGEK